tara:strand:+ start:560 stop:1705 length:1146 start_codon:yes stop_codon:yes gene_type:complete
MKKKIFTALGLMSGTSMDGVDLSVVKSDGNAEFTQILDKYFEFDQNLQKSLLNLRNYLISIKDLEKFSKEINEVEREFTLFNAKIINEFITEYSIDFDLIGFHGQTIFHNPSCKISRQLGDGKLLSQMTKKIVINNFRENDLINGGQGAPLTPIFHKVLSKTLKNKNKITFPMNILNIGGITNITQVLDDNDARNDNFYALDIAPGNCLIDEWVRKNSNQKFDNKGEIAKSGKVNNLILDQAIDNFYIKSFDKSLDIKDFDISFAKGLSLEDGCATITKFTAHLISRGINYINNQNNSLPVLNLISGGGRKNNYLVQSIKDCLSKNQKLIDIEKYGLKGDFIESQAFGYLSIRTYLKLPISFPKTTFCKNPTIGGNINSNF